MYANGAFLYANRYRCKSLLPLREALEQKAVYR